MAWRAHLPVSGPHRPLAGESVTENTPMATKMKDDDTVTTHWGGELKALAARDATLEKARTSAADQTVRAIGDLIADGNDAIHRRIGGSIAGCVKGRHHTRKTVAQIVRHSVKVPLSVALVPLGIAFSATALTAPVGLVAIESSLGSNKAMADYIRVHGQGYAGLDRSIEKNRRAVRGTFDAREAAEKKMKEARTAREWVEATEEGSKVKGGDPPARVRCPPRQEVAALT